METWETQPAVINPLQKRAEQRKVRNGSKGNDEPMIGTLWVESREEKT